MNKDYIASEYRRLHAANKFRGGTLYDHIPVIKDLVKEYDCQTLLDYGSGQGVYHLKTKLAPAVVCFDPYYEPFSKKPTGKFDIVICTDVMEHVPEDDVKATLSEIFDYAEKVLYLAICTKAAIKKFSDGTNVHLTVRPKEWWDEYIDSLNTKGLHIVRSYS